MTDDLKLTINCADAEELYHSRGEVGLKYGPWTLVADVRGDSGRWTEWWTFVLRHKEHPDALWGLDYGLGLTENQDHTLPWKDKDGPLTLYRLYAHTVTTVEYLSTP